MDHLAGGPVATYCFISTVTFIGQSTDFISNASVHRRNYEEILIYIEHVLRVLFTGNQLLGSCLAITLD